ncbi:hypothetical protein R1sor_026602 [Riccia sorocarpa]|uniref:F-box domain-containing protein n=1 Tax=Riccia sorocarpa TaxID=122646 RepID=A0ABD3GHJ2_9MARC
MDFNVVVDTNSPLHFHQVDGQPPCTKLPVSHLLIARVSVVSAMAEMGNTDLSCTLWQHLLVEVLEKVLTKLPVSALTRFCRVCKRWKSLIESAEFARECRSAEPVIFSYYPGGFSYSDCKKLNPYLAIPNTKTYSWEKHVLSFTSGPISLVAADHGLLCFMLLKGNHNTLFVYKPLTRQWTKLKVPERSKIEKPSHYPTSRPSDDGKMLVGLSVDPDTGNYKLVVGFIKAELQPGEKPRLTLIYDSLSSAWTTSSACPDFFSHREEDEDEGYWKEWIPQVSVRSGESFYWLVDEETEMLGNTFTMCGTSSRFLVKYNIREGTWMVDEPDLPYERFVEEEDIPNCLPPNLPYAHLIEYSYPRLHRDFRLPQWNFHLASHGGSVYVTLFDSLINRDSFSGEFSSVISEVKVTDAELVRRLLELANPPEHYIPTMALAQDDFWYVAFEFGGVCSEERGMKPLLVFAHSPRRQVSRWLPPLGLDSSCSDVLPRDYPPDWLPQLYTFAATFRAFV